MVQRENVWEKVSPAPLNPVSIVYTIDNSLKKVNKNGSVKLTKQGLMEITLNNKKFLGAFSYLTAERNAFGIGTVSFTFQSADPSSRAYALLASYEYGAQQKIVPYIANFDNLSQFMDELGLDYYFDRNEGILKIYNIMFKPDFYIFKMNSEEQNYYNSYKNKYGLAFQAEDVNHDGVIDIKYYASDGIQILYRIK